MSDSDPRTGDRLRSIDPGRAKRLAAAFDRSPFGRLLGLRVEAVEPDYSRLRLPFRPQLLQPSGVVHGGAIASLLDTAAAVAIFSGLDRLPRTMATVDLHVQYLEAVAAGDLIAECRVRRRGGSLVFVGAEVRTESGVIAAHGALSFKVTLSERSLASIEADEAEP